MIMTYGFDLERLCVALESVEKAARDVSSRHEPEDWLVHRLAHIRAEAKSLNEEIRKARCEHGEDS